jgi:hypothetical protein
MVLERTAEACAWNEMLKDLVTQLFNFEHPVVNLKSSIEVNLWENMSNDFVTYFFRLMLISYVTLEVFVKPC